MIEEISQKRHLKGILLTLGVCALEFLITALYLYPKSQRGELVSVSRATENLLGAFRQSIIPFLFPAVLLVLFVLLLKKDFSKQLYMTMRGNWQRIAAIVLCAATMGLTVYCLIVKEDRISILFSLLYYYIFVAFTEEFVCRDVCTFFLRDAAWPVRYLIPNICFAFLHVFSYADWSGITGIYLIRFLTSGLPGYVVMGCVFQLLKEKSGTIWLPVLLHGLMDFSIVLKY